MALGLSLLRECSGLIYAESCPVPCIACCSHQDDRWLGAKKGPVLKPAPCIIQGSCWAQRHPSVEFAEPNLFRTHTKPLVLARPNVAHSAVLGTGTKEREGKKKKDLLQVPCSVYASTCSSPVFQNAVAATWYCLLHQIHRHSMPTFPTSFACILRSIPISSCFVYAHVPIID